MDESWYSIVSSEVNSVDEYMRKGVRSAYPELNDMCEATLNSSYHYVRPALCLLSYHANSGQEPKDAIALSSCLESVFDGLHLHDLVDSDGKVKNLKRKFFSGASSTTKVIVAGDFMYIMGFRLAYSSAPKAVPYLMRASASMSDAIFDIVDNYHNPDVTEEVCISILNRKSAVEYQIVMESAAKQAGAEDRMDDMNRCGTFIGAAIHTMFDMMDLFGDGRNKPQMDTLISGYPTMPLFFAMDDPKIGAKVKEAFSSTSLSLREASDVVSTIKGSDAIDRCLAFIRENASKAKDYLASLPDSRYKAALSDYFDSIGEYNV